jgi:hypothetical protein
MKNFILTSVLMVLGTLLIAQAPKKMSYQAVIRNSSDQLVTNHIVGMRISILHGSATGTPVYIEIQTPTTNVNGLVTIEIGGGTPVTGAFSEINWPSGIYFIKTETDPKGGTSYSIIGTSQILSVPYALYAAAAPPTTNANAISSGTLDPLYYSAYSDLISEGRLDNATGSDILTRAQADSRYYQKIGFFAFNSDYEYNYDLMTQKIEFNQEPFDDGNCFDNTKDRFVAPVAGVYNFSVTVGFSNPSFVNDAWHFFYLYRNGEKYCLINEISSHEKATVSSSITLKLAASDYIEIYLSSPQVKIFGDDTDGTHNTFFTGHLVYPIL